MFLETCEKVTFWSKMALFGAKWCKMTGKWVFWALLGVEPGTKVLLSMTLLEGKSDPLLFENAKKKKISPKGLVHGQNSSKMPKGEKKKDRS